MKDLKILLSPFYWSVKNDILAFNRAFYRKTFFYLFSALIFMYVVTWLLNAGMLKLQDLSPEVFNVLLIKGYSLIFMIIFFVQLINGFIMSLDRFYQSEELELLLTSPVDRSALFFARLIETHIKASWMLIVFGLPMLMSVGLHRNANLLYYFYSCALFAVFSIIPVNIGAGITMMLSGSFNIKRLRKFFISTGLITVLAMVALFRMSRPERFVNPEMFANLKLFLVGLQTPSFILLPNRWLSESLFNYLDGSYRGTLIYIALLLLTSYITVYFLMIVYRKYYYRGWSLLQGGEAVLKKAPHLSSTMIWTAARIVRSGLSFGIFSRLDKDKAAILKKDLLYQFKDTRNLHQHLILMLLVTVYLFSIASLPMNWEGYVLQIKYFVFFFNTGLILVVIASLCSRLIYPVFVSEGNSLWIIKTSPVTPGKYLWSKFLFLLVPVFILGQFLTVFSSYFIDIEAALFILIILTTTLVSCSLIGMSIMFGMSDLIKMTKKEEGEEIKTGNVFYMITSFLLILFILAIEIIPVYLFYMKKSVKVEFISAAWVIIGTVVLLLFIVNVLVTLASMRRSIRKLDSIQLG